MKALPSSEKALNPRIGIASAVDAKVMTAHAVTPATRRRLAGAGNVTV
jgi:hypothetical protein